jgi:hypothetical protein
MWNMVLPLVLLLGLAGCRGNNAGGTGRAATVPERFSCQITARYKEREISGGLRREGAGTLELTVEEPETLRGLRMIWNGETFRAEMEGLVYETGAGTLPEGALGSCLLRVFDTITVSGKKGTAIREGLQIQGETADGPFIVVINPDTGAPRSLELPSAELTAVFDGYSNL